MQRRQLMEPCMKPAAQNDQKDPSAETAEAAVNASDASCRKVAERLRPHDVAEDGGRERLKRHRREMAGHVRIPEKWGLEASLKDWAADYTAFDRSLFPKGLRTAKEALVEECTGARLRMGNRCQLDQFSF